MVKKVRFNDKVQVNKMSIDLNDHIKEVKSAKDIIINPDKTSSPIEDPPIEDPPIATDRDIHNPSVRRIFGIPFENPSNYLFWILVGIILLIALGIFSVTKTGRQLFGKKED
jgi:hypothetical protein